MTCREYPMVVITYKRCIPGSWCPFPFSSIPSCIADSSPRVTIPPATQHRNTIWKALELEKWKSHLFSPLSSFVCSIYSCHNTEQWVWEFRIFWCKGNAHLSDGEERWGVGDVVMEIKLLVIVLESSNFLRDFWACQCMQHTAWATLCGLCSWICFWGPLNFNQVWALDGDSIGCTWDIWIKNVKLIQLHIGSTSVSKRDICRYLTFWYDEDTCSVVFTLI